MKKKIDRTTDLLFFFLLCSKWLPNCCVSDEFTTKGLAFYCRLLWNLKITVLRFWKGLFNERDQTLTDPWYKATHIIARTPAAPSAVKPLTCAYGCAAGVRQQQAGVPGDGADAWRRAAGPHPQAEVLLREGGQRRAAHHHPDRGVPALSGGETTPTFTQARRPLDESGNTSRFFF